MKVCYPLLSNKKQQEKKRITVLPAKSDSYVMLVFKVIRDLESINHLCINPIRRIGLILN